MQEIISNVAVDVSLAVLSLLMAYATAAVRKVATKVKLETQQIQKADERNMLLDAIDDVEQLAEKTVKHIEQTTAKALRQSVKDGLKDQSELAALSLKAFEEIANALRPECKELIANNFGSFETYLKKTIESQVLALKSTS